MMQAYHLWDHRQTICRTLLVAFGICITATTILSVLAVLNVLKTGADSQNACGTIRTPKIIITCTLAVLLLFNAFVIFITVYNALEMLHCPENSVLDSLRHDGAQTYLAICSTQ
ncbi:hypothetical protein EDD18DRAFT_1345328 [Armillaria luteobubalina]|uniref:Uncharacterized protein n=1 Tax=Armillaria luteobubalina TaxID=153913 RepID=A0AA39QK47_9AGAR|nr:hypothetical protein EDD18DRAFT_1345328 [Armillaria luteobubalina]